MAIAILSGLPAPRKRTANHLLNEFAQQVTLMAETQHQEENVGSLVKELVTALNEQARAKPGILHYVNLFGLIALVFWSGVFYQRVLALEIWKAEQVQVYSQLKSVDTMAVQISNFQTSINAQSLQMSRMEDRLNRYIEAARAGRQ